MKRKRSPHEAFGSSQTGVKSPPAPPACQEKSAGALSPMPCCASPRTRASWPASLSTRNISRGWHGNISRRSIPALAKAPATSGCRPARLTELVRRKLGLNQLLPDHNFGGGADQKKNRLDHRHHAIDAFVIGVVDRSLLQRMARASASGGDEHERIEVPDPWDGFREELRDAVRNIVVSHRVDHGTASKSGLRRGFDQTAGRLHNDTAYGLTGETDAKGNTIVVRRVPLLGLKPEHLPPEATTGVRDPILRAALKDFTRGSEGKAFEAALRRFPELGPLDYRGIRRVRLSNR